MTRGKVREILRRRGQKRREERQEIQRSLRETIRLLRRLGYQESAVDHISRLHISEETLDFLLQLGIQTISDLAQAALTRGGVFKSRKEWQKSEFRDRVVAEALDALIEYYSVRLELLQNLRKQLAKD